MWLGVGAALALVALAGILALAISPYGPRVIESRDQLYWVTAILAYFPLRFLSRAVLGRYFGARSRIVEAVPWVLIALIYAAYFLLVA
jgi:hypothetical protein